MGVSINFEQANGKQAIVDGYSGEIFIEPTKNLLKEYRGLILEESELSSMVNRDLSLPAKNPRWPTGRNPT